MLREATKNDARDDPESQRDDVELWFRLSPSAEISMLDTTYRWQMYQVVAGEKRLQVDANGRRLLEYLRIPRTTQHVQVFLAESALTIDAQKLTTFLDTCVASGIIIATEDSDPIESPPPRPRRRPAGLVVCIPIVPHRRLSVITRPLVRLFSPPVAVACLLLISWVCCDVFARHIRAVAQLQSSFMSLSAVDWLLLVLLNVIALFFHELGHSAACTRYGCRHGSLGIGLYLIYPVFFVDVSNTWSLPRLKRVVVDSGGIYFHLIFASACYIGWLATHGPLLLITVYCIAMSVLLNLNPFFKFDGYWILSDLIGVPNLYSAGKGAARYYWHAIRGQEMQSRPRLLQFHAGARAAVLVYSFALLAFTLYCLFMLGSQLLPAVIRSIPQLGYHLFALIDGWHFGADLWATALKLLLVGSSVWGLFLMIGKALAYCFHWVNGQLRSRKQPVLRTGARPL